MKKDVKIVDIDSECNFDLLECNKDGTLDEHCVSSFLKKCGKYSNNGEKWKNKVSIYKKFIDHQNDKRNEEDIYIKKFLRETKEECKRKLEYGTGLNSEIFIGKQWLGDNVKNKLKEFGAKDIKRDIIGMSITCNDFLKNVDL